MILRRGVSPRNIIMPFFEDNNRPFDKDFRNKPFTIKTSTKRWFYFEVEI
jgi:hypothetical protein